MEITPLVAEEYHLKTWKVILNVIVSVVLAFLLQALAGLLFYFLFGDWQRMIIPIMIVVVLGVYVVMELINRKTTLEKSLALNITGWILIVVGVIGILIGLLSKGGGKVGNVYYVLNGFALKSLEKVGVHFKS